MSLAVSRKSVTTVLKESLDNNKEAINFEKEIFKMCERLSKEYEDDTIEEIYDKYAFEKTGDILNANGEEERNRVMKDIKNNVLDWESAPYKEFREKREKENEQLIKGVETVISDYKCKNKECGSRRCIQSLVQTRSGDEGFTVFVTCLDCGKKGSFD